MKSTKFLVVLLMAVTLLAFIGCPNPVGGNNPDNPNNPDTPADSGETVTITGTASEVLSRLENLSSNANIKVTGTITNKQFSDMMDKINWLAYELRFTFDLSETTGLTSISRVNWQITEFTIPASVTQISEGAFSSQNIDEIKIAEGNTSYKVVNGVLYTIDGATLLCYPAGVVGDSFSVPSGVTAISIYAFYGCSNLSSVSIPNSVTSIGNYAFMGCSNLASISIPESVTNIGWGAFGNTGLTSINFAVTNGWYYNEEGARKTVSLAELTDVSNYTGYQRLFYKYGIYRRPEITVAASELLSTIQNLASSANIKVTGAITNVQFHQVMDAANQLSYDKEFALDMSGTTGLTEINRISNRINSFTIPASVTQISQGAFSSGNIDEIKIAEGNTSYKVVNGVLYTIDGATLLCYPAGVVGDSFSVPSGVTRIVDYAFNSGANVCTISIPSSVTEIGNGAFTMLRNLVEIRVDSGNAAYKSLDGALYTADGKKLIRYPPKKTGNVFTIPNTVESIEELACMDAYNLSSVSIPNSVTSIGYWAFSRCSSLTSISIPNSVTSIGYCAFMGCSNLASISIPESVTNIGWGAFIYAGLTSINFAVTNGWYYNEEGARKTVSLAELTDVSNYTGYQSLFGEYGIYRRPEITVAASELLSTIQNLASSANIKVTGAITNEQFRQVMDAANQLSDDKEFALDMSETTGLTSISWVDWHITEFTIPASVTQISEGAFKDGELSVIKIAEGNTSYKVVNGVLYTIDGATLLCYPAGVVGDSFSVPSGVTRIARYAFNSGANVCTISIPSSVTEIGARAFGGPNLVEIRVDSGNAAYKSLDGVLYTADGKKLIRYPPKKTGNVFTIPNTVESIEELACMYAYNLSSVSIPNSVTSIGYWAFCVCYNLTNITIPASVMRIYEEVFSDSGLSSITFSVTDGWYFYDSNGERSATVEELTNASNYTSNDGLFHGSLYRKED